MTTILALEVNGLAMPAYAALAGALGFGLLNRRLGWILALIALGLGLAAQLVTPTGLGFLILMALAVHLTYRSGVGQTTQRTAFLVAGVTLTCVMLHLLPGFHNSRVLHRVVFSPDASPYTMYLNFDKPFMALLVLLCGSAIEFPNFVRPRWSKVAWWTASTTVFAAILGLTSGFIHFDPKWPDVSWFWLLNNLLLVCLVEEVIFRGFLLGKILELAKTRTRFATPLAVGISSLLFGTVHLPGGLIFALFAAVLGIFYALAYLRSGALIGSILVHLTVNAVHFFLFTYPSVARIH